MTKQTNRLPRRNFLLTIGAGGAATAAAIGAKSVPQAPPVSGRGKRDERGYHASEHVNTYYRTARF